MVDLISIKKEHTNYENEVTHFFSSALDTSSSEFTKTVHEIEKLEDKLDHHLETMLFEIEHFTEQALITVEQHEQTALNIIIGIFVGSLILGGILSIGIIRSIVPPLQSLTDVIEDITAGNYDVKIGFQQKNDEIGAIARAIEFFKKTGLENK